MRQSIQKVITARPSYSPRSFLYTVYRHHHKLTHEQAVKRVIEDIGGLKSIACDSDKPGATQRFTPNN